MRIQRLPDELARKIAAGEVVERPMSVVKELIENSLDAGAKTIRVELVQGGKTLISVCDDGSGISPDDLLLAVEKHATSKISTESDLEAISSLGYRGEALASIAAVSRLELYSRERSSQTGAGLTYSDGRPAVHPMALPAGTTVTVKDLFYNLPARRKFLKSALAEYRRISRLLQDYALCWPYVSFELVNDGQTSFSSRADGTVEGALLQMWGKEPQIEKAQGEVNGSVAELWRQDTGPGSRFQLILFVNGRRVSDGAVRAAILSHPWASRGNWFLKLTIPADEMDVNVHPAKTEVLFRKGSEVFELVRKTAEEFGRGFTQLPLSGPAAPKETAWRPSEGPKDFFRSIDPPFRVASPSAQKSSVQLRGVVSLSDPAASIAAEAMGTEAERGTEAGWKNEPAELFPDEKPQVLYFGQMSQGYLVFQDEQSLLVVDPHAAHERVNFERFSQGVKSGPAERLAVHLPLTPDVRRQAEENKKDLDSLGFGFDEQFQLAQVPCHAGVSAGAMELLRGALAAVEDGQDAGRPLIDRWAMKACKASVKLTTRLTPQEACQLLSDLESCQQPTACPHGRPTVLRLTAQALDDHFGRNGL